MAFMVFYYKLSGAVSVLALLLNLVILMGALGFFEATLTLPGIAGIILTVGMAVDANVLIFERIREELRLGKTVRSAVDAGYGKAFLTILDSNITTLVAALVLLQFGTGPIKGFAITLSMGLIASMFTAIFVTRLVYDFVLSRHDVRSLSI
jgi:preprotein translocase subunit SecD